MVGLAPGMTTSEKRRLQAFSIVSARGSTQADDHGKGHHEQGTLANPAKMATTTSTAEWECPPYAADPTERLTKLARYVDCFESALNLSSMYWVRES